MLENGPKSLVNILLDRQEHNALRQTEPCSYDRDSLRSSLSSLPLGVAAWSDRRTAPSFAAAARSFQSSPPSRPRVSTGTAKDGASKEGGTSERCRFGSLPRRRCRSVCS